MLAIFNRLQNITRVQSILWTDSKVEPFIIENLQCSSLARETVFEINIHTQKSAKFFVGLKVSLKITIMACENEQWNKTQHRLLKTKTIDRWQFTLGRISSTLFQVNPNYGLFQMIVHILLFTLTSTV